MARWAYLDRVEETEGTAARTSKVVVPGGEGLEGVHERAIETVRGGRDEAAGFWSDETGVGRTVAGTYRRTIHACNLMRRELLYHLRLGSTNWR